MISDKRIEQLRRSIPEVLTRPVVGSARETTKAALRRYALAEGCDCEDLDPANVPLPGTEPAGRWTHVCILALQFRALAEDQFTRVAWVEELDSAHRKDPLDHFMTEFAGLHVQGFPPVEPRAFDSLDAISVALQPDLHDIRALELELDRRRQDVRSRYLEAERLRARLYDPILMSGYMHRSNADARRSEQTCLLYYLTRILGVDLPIAIVMVGGFRRRDVAADLAHDRVERIHSAFEQGLTRLERMIRKSQQTGHRCVYLSVETGELMRQKDLRAASTPKKHR